MDASLGKYGFPGGHAFSPDRQDAFWKEALRRGLHQQVEVAPSRMATDEELQRFHTPDHVTRVKTKSAEGHGSLDYGDTPAYRGVHEAAAASITLTRMIRT